MHARFFIFYKKILSNVDFQCKLLKQACLHLQVWMGWMNRVIIKPKKSQFILYLPFSGAFSLFGLSILWLYFDPFCKWKPQKNMKNSMLYLSDLLLVFLSTEIAGKVWISNLCGIHCGSVCVSGCYTFQVRCCKGKQEEALILFRWIRRSSNCLCAIGISWCSSIGPFFLVSFYELVRYLVVGDLL